MWIEFLHWIRLAWIRLWNSFVARACGVKGPFGTRYKHIHVRSSCGHPWPRTVPDGPFTPQAQNAARQPPWLEELQDV